MLAKISYTPDMAESLDFALPTNMQADKSLINALRLGIMVGSNRTDPTDVEILDVNGLIPGVDRRLASKAGDTMLAVPQPRYGHGSLRQMQAASVAKPEPVRRLQDGATT